MAFVIDASVTACWALPDEDHPHAAAALALTFAETVHVPELWWFEICNTLLAAERRNRISAADVEAFVGQLRRMTLRVDRTTDAATTMSLARKHRLTFYDASYLELARRLAMPLATLDKALIAAARQEAVLLIGA